MRIHVSVYRLCSYRRILCCALRAGSLDCKPPQGGRCIKKQNKQCCKKTIRKLILSRRRQHLSLRAYRCSGFLAGACNPEYQPEEHNKEYDDKSIIDIR